MYLPVYSKCLRLLCFCFLVNLNFLIRMHAIDRTASASVETLDMLRHTLNKMASGGINDHVCKVEQPATNERGAFQSSLLIFFYRDFTAIPRTTTGMCRTSRRCCMTRHSLVLHTPKCTRQVYTHDVYVSVLPKGIHKF